MSDASNISARLSGDLKVLFDRVTAEYPFLSDRLYAPEDVSRLSAVQMATNHLRDVRERVSGDLKEEIITYLTDSDVIAVSSANAPVAFGVGSLIGAAEVKGLLVARDAALRKYMDFVGLELLGSDKILERAMGSLVREVRGKTNWVGLAKKVQNNGLTQKIFDEFLGDDFRDGFAAQVGGAFSEVVNRGYDSTAVFREKSGFSTLKNAPKRGMNLFSAMFGDDRAQLNASFQSQVMYDTINKGLNEYWFDDSPLALARKLRESFFLDTRGLDALERMRRSSSSDPGDGLPLRQRLSSYSTKLSNQRIKMISRTNANNLLNSGRSRAILHLVDEGLLPESTQVMWITAQDEAVCKTCAPMDGSIRSVFGEFVLPDGREITHPPAHPNCRCVIIPVFDEELEEIGKSIDVKGYYRDGKYVKPHDRTGDKDFGEKSRAWWGSLSGPEKMAVSYASLYLFKTGVRTVAKLPVIDRNIWSVGSPGKLKPETYKKYEGKTVEETLSKVESVIRGRRIEYAAVIDPTSGRIIEMSRGTKGAVWFDGESLSNMSGKIVTHNHPNSSPLSGPDMSLFSQYGLKEIRAVQRNTGKVTSLKRTSRVTDKDDKDLNVFALATYDSLTRKALLADKKNLVTRGSFFGISDDVLADYFKKNPQWEYTRWKTDVAKHLQGQHDQSEHNWRTDDAKDYEKAPDIHSYNPWDRKKTVRRAPVINNRKKLKSMVDMLNDLDGPEPPSSAAAKIGPITNRETRKMEGKFNFRFGREGESVTRAVNHWIAFSGVDLARDIQANGVTAADKWLKSVRGQFRDVQDMANFLNLVKEAKPNAPELYRGMMVDASYFDDNPVGTVFETPISSWTSSKDVAGYFASGGAKRKDMDDNLEPVLVVLDEGSRSVNISGVSSGLNWGTKEWVSQGRYEVVRFEEPSVSYGLWGNRTRPRVVHVRHIEDDVIKKSDTSSILAALLSIPLGQLKP